MINRFITDEDYRKHPIFLAIHHVAMHKAKSKCACGKPATEVHHIHHPRPSGAFDTPGNLKPICHACHRKLHDKTS